MSRQGLTSAEAARRLRVFGPNEPVPGGRHSAAIQFLHLFANPLVAILIAAAAIAGSLGQAADAVIIITIVLVGVLIDFWQTSRSHRAIERLRASVAPTATVLRDGAWLEVPMREVVRDDVVRLGAGDLVPADARLIEARDLSVQQAMLTGESLPVDKSVVDADASSDEADPAAGGRVFLGTSVVSGTGTAVVTATGRKTAFGDIAARLAERPPDTEFERGIRRFSVLILRTTLVLVLFILLVGVSLKHDALESLLFAVAVGVGLTPEFLPMIAAVTLSHGAIRMARHQVIVKHLPAIQNLGSIDILCSDKTGTLTSGEMRLDAAIDPMGAPSWRPFTLAYINSRFETGIRSPLDVAILAHGAVDVAGYEKLDEIPFDFERRCLSIVVTPPDGAVKAPILIIKGAPEEVLGRSDRIEVEGAVQPLDQTTRAGCSAVYRKLSAEGFRVLAVAHRSVPLQKAYARDDECELVLAGFIAFADPVLPETTHVLARLHADGVAIKIVTGDNDLVARHVCQQVGLDATRLVTGEELGRLDDAALGHVAERATVFARVSPSQKNRIILALQRRGHIVGFLGDGVNDAPSLHSADVGISVRTAADVAREAADIVLGQSSLRALHRGIIEGRRASGNMMKCLLMETSSNFGNMFSMAVASVVLPFLPMLPMQILLNNFLYDLAQIAIPLDTVDPEYVQRPQRWNVRLVRDFMLFIGPISSVFDFLTFFVLLRYFQATEVLFHTGWFVESLATQTLVLGVIRTMRNPLRSRPSRPLVIAMLAVVATGTILPMTPLAAALGFTIPPLRYLAFVGAATVTYLALVELIKRHVARRHPTSPKSSVS